jgi:hypothetical protein
LGAFIGKEYDNILLIGTDQFVFVAAEHGQEAEHGAFLVVIHFYLL